MLQHLGSHAFAEGSIDAAALDSTASTVLLCFRRVLVVLRLGAAGGLEACAPRRFPGPTALRTYLHLALLRRKSAARSALPRYAPRRPAPCRRSVIAAACPAGYAPRLT